MPIVPSTSVRSSVQSTYQVRSTSSAGGLVGLGSGINQAGHQIVAAERNKEDKEAEVDGNAAILKTMEARTKATISFKENTKRQDIPLEDYAKYKAEYDNAISNSVEEGGKGITTQKGRDALLTWAKGDDIARLSNSADYNSKKLDSINIESTTNQLLQAQALAIANPTMDNFKGVSTAISANSKARNLNAVEQDLFVKQQRQSTMNSVVDNYINNDDPHSALDFINKSKDDMDAKTYDHYETRLNNEINTKNGNNAGSFIQKQSEVIGETGIVVQDYKKGEAEVNKLPEGIREIARNKFLNDASRAAMIRDQSSLLVYFSKVEDADAGRLDPEELPGVEKATLGVERMRALNNMYGAAIGRVQNAQNEKENNIAKASTFTSTLSLHDRLSDLAPQDRQRAPAILEAMLQEGEFIGKITQSDKDAVRKYAVNLSAGDDNVTNDDIISAVAQIKNLPELLNRDNKEYTKFSKDSDNAGLITFVHKYAYGVPKEDIAKRVLDLTSEYYIQTRDQKNLGDVLASGDAYDIANIQLDEFSNVDSPHFKAAFAKLNVEKLIGTRLTDDVKRKLVSSAYLRNIGLETNYNVVNGKIVPIDNEVLLSGSKLNQLIERYRDPAFDPEQTQGNMFGD